MWTLTGLMFTYLLWSVIPSLERIQKLLPSQFFSLSLSHTHPGTAEKLPIRPHTVRRRQYTDREEKPKKAYICIDLCLPALFVLGVLWEELQCFCYCGSWITSLVCGGCGCFWRDIKLLESSCRGLRRAWFRCLTTGSKACPRDGEVGQSSWNPWIGNSKWQCCQSVWMFAIHSI
jgi:hypothetical protein